MDEIDFTKDFKENVCPKLGEYAGAAIDKQMLRKLRFFPPIGNPEKPVIVVPEWMYNTMLDANLIVDGKYYGIEVIVPNKLDRT